MDYGQLKTAKDHFEAYADLSSGQGFGIPSLGKQMMVQHATAMKKGLDASGQRTAYNKIKSHANALYVNDEISDDDRKFIHNTYAPSTVKEETDIELDEKKMTPAEMAKREKIVKSMKKNFASFKTRYGDRAKEVMYATATNQAMATEDVENVDEGFDDRDPFSRYKRAFKMRELEHELRHEEDPKKRSKSRYSSYTAPKKDEPHAVHINGKKWKTFGSLSHAQNVANKIKGATVQKEDVESVEEGKVKLYTDPDYFGAEVNDRGFDRLPVVNIPAHKLVGFEPDDKMKQPKSQANIKKIVAGLKKGDKLPPVLVRQHKNGYQVLDGHHRFHAYKLLGVKSIPAKVVSDKDIEEIGKQGVAEDQHYCAKHVYSEVFGEGFVVEGQHAEPDENGNIEWYTVQFEHGEEVIFTEDVEIMMAEYHANHSPAKKKKKAMKAE